MFQLLHPYNSPYYVSSSCQALGAGPGQSGNVGYVDALCSWGWGEVDRLEGPTFEIRENVL